MTATSDDPGGGEPVDDTLHPRRSDTAENKVLNHKRWWSSRLLRAALGVTAGGGAIWVVVSAAGGLTDAGRAIQAINGLWLAPAIAFEALAYVLSGLRLRRLAGPDADLGAGAAIALTVVVNGLGLLTPAAPAEGMAFEYNELRSRGLPRRRIALTMGFEQWFSTRVFVLVQAINLLLIVSWRDLPTDTGWVLTAAACVLALLAVTAVLANRATTAERIMVVLGAVRFWRPRTPLDDRRAAGADFHRQAMEVVGPPRRRVTIMGLSVASLLSDTACLWMVMMAAGLHHGFEIAVLVVGAAGAAAMVPFLPGGIGVVEAAIPGVLAWYGTPVRVGLAVAVTYRVLGTFLPAGVGVPALIALRAHRRTRAAPETTTT